MEKIPKESESAAQNHVLLEWTAPEFIKYAKGKIWFAMGGIVVAFFVLYAIQTQSLTMAIAFIVLAGVYAISHHREPQNVNIQITELGIRVGTRLVPFNQMKAFWLIYQPPGVTVLKLLTTDKFMNELTIQLGEQAPGPVRNAMLRHVPEYEGRGESFIDILIRSTRL